MSDKRQVTMKDVAIRANVALGTVSRIINGNKTVARELRDHVNSVIEELGYHPNVQARSIRTKKTNVIGMVVTDIRQPSAARLMAAASELVRKAGYASIIGDFHNDLIREEELFRFMSGRGVDGLLLTISSDENPALVERLLQIKKPIVLWERDVNGALPSVRSDHRAGARCAARLLCDRGRKRILLVAAHEKTWSGREQVHGATGGMAGRAKLDIICTGHSVPEKLAGQLGRYDAIIANIHDIPQIMLMLRQAGKTVPTDVSVISIGDDPFLEISNPTITAIQIRSDIVGASAARMLLRELGHDVSEKRQESIVVPTGLAMRQSI